MASKNGMIQADPNLLLPRIAQGDSGAVKECIDRYGALVWSLVRKSIQNHSHAEDAVQEIFISLWKAADRFDPQLGSEPVFITTIARRRLIDRHRRHLRGPELESLDEVVLADPDPGLARVDLGDEAGQALAVLERLRPEQRKLLEMSIVGGMTHNEIATSVGLPLGTVKSQIRRGLLRVRGLLQDGRFAPSTEVTA